MKKVFYSILMLTSFTVFAQQEQSKDTIKTLDEIVIQGVRIKKTDPFTQTNLNKKEMETKNLGQDLPVLLNLLPNVVTTSDAGAGVGYTGIRVRGSDATRVNVTINGIALNDSESQSVYWVNLPDFSSSTGSVQLQRGVGTSANGAGAFGASLNLLTEGFSEKPKIQFQNSFGSFNTHKHNLQYQSGKVNDHIYVSGRFSTVHSDGYIDRATSDLRSLYFSIAYRNEKTLIKFLNFGGHEKTYQAWYGVDKTTFEQHPTLNYAGAIYDENGNITDYYDNQTDNYTQIHNQLHFNHHLNATIDISAALHYTRGYGYYEEYKQDAKLSNYSINQQQTNCNCNFSDLIRRKWLDNHYYGAVFSLKYDTHNRYKMILGGAINQYDGDHFGKVIWLKNSDIYEFDHQYYFNNGLKNELNLYQKMQFQLTKKWNVFTDIQYRNVFYTTDSFLPTVVSERYHFFNPKAGITYSISPQNLLYASYAQAHKEPVRDDFEYAVIKPQAENLHDFELGWRSSKNQKYWQLNAYYMLYKNQLVLTGAINDEGEYVRTNSGESYRAGVEFESVFKLHQQWHWMPNVSYSINQNVNYFDENTQKTAHTNISFSPDWVVGNRLVFQPYKYFNMSLNTKYVGQQFMSNNEHVNSILKPYTTTDFLISWQQTEVWNFQNFAVTLMFNNILDVPYISNGYMYEDVPYYYPQAGFHFLAGIDFSF